MQMFPLTVEGEQMLRAELDELKTIGRPRLSAAIADARSHGDLKENAEYHAAREEQGLMEARISHIESVLSACQVIDVKSMTNSGKIIFGATIALVNIDTDEEVTYKIVGEDEADLKYNKISVTSPIARALVGKFVEDDVVVETPNGDVAYEVLRVDYI